MDILFSDNHLFIVNKPAGIPTQPSPHHTDSAESQAKAYIRMQSHKPGDVFLHAIHRIDRAVSGAVVFARTSKALSRLQLSCRNHSMRKKYYAIVEGTLQQQEGTLEHFLTHESFHAAVVAATHPNAKKARLFYRTVAVDNQHTLLEIELETGRYHQIRVQMAAIGHPIFGDTKYYAKESAKMAPQTIALHHHQIEFPHPTQQRTCTVQAPLPQSGIWSHFSSLHNKNNSTHI